MREQEDYWWTSGNITYTNIATNDDFISTFNTAVTNLAAHFSQGDVALSQLSESIQTMQSNLNTIKHEFQAIKHQMNYSATQSPLRIDSIGPSRFIYVVTTMQPHLPPPTPDYSPFVPSPLHRHISTGT